jgi:hypothetical protein
MCCKLLIAGGGGGVGYVMSAGFVLQQWYIPAEHQTNLTQNSHFKEWIL